MPSEAEMVLVPRAVVQGLIDRITINECRHESTHRSGLIWTICDDCGRKWADDQGGFVPYEEPAALTDAYRALSAASAVRSEPVKVLPLAWEVEEPNWWVARSIVGGYEVRQTDSGKVRTRRVGEGWEYFDGTAEQAKSAMQEHYTNAVLSAITSPVQTREDGIRAEAQFLLDRLNDFEPYIGARETFRQYAGHVSPSVERLRALLSQEKANT